MAFDTNVFNVLRSGAVDLYRFFYLVVEGSPYIFTTAGVTSLPADFKPTGFSTAALKPLLKMGQGLDPIREEASRKMGVAAMQEVTLALGPDLDDFLLALFAGDHPNILRTTLAQTLDWTDVTIHLSDASSFPASGTVVVGKEAITYTGKATNDLTGCTRGALGTVCNRYGVGDELYAAPTTVRDRISSWEGKVAHLYMGLTDGDGNVLQRARPQEIFAGPIASNPDSEDYTTWSFTVRDYTALLDTEIGGFKVQGKMPTPDKYETVLDVENVYEYCWIQSGVNDRLRVTIDGTLQYDGGAPFDISGTIDLTLNPGFYWNLPFTLSALINAELAANPLDPDLAVTCAIVNAASAATPPDPLDESSYLWRVKWTLYSALGWDTGYAYSLEILIDVTEPDSVWPHLGFSYAGTTKGGPPDGATDYLEHTFQAAAELPTLFVFDERSRTLPVFLNQGQYSQIAQVVPATGILLVGETEVVTYSSVASSDPAIPFPNCYLFTLGEHSTYGSRPYEYRLRWVFDGGYLMLGVIGDSPTVTAMYGVDGGNVFDLLLKLMISTGGNRYAAGTYATWDTAEFPEVFGTPLPGTCIDVVSFQSAAAAFKASFIQRSLAFSEPQNLRSLVDEQLVLLGLCLLPRPLTDGTYKLSLVNTSNLLNTPGLDVVESGGYYSLGIAAAANAVSVVGVESGLRPVLKHDLNDVVNRAIVKPLYDVAAEKTLDWTWTYTDVDSRLDFGVLHSMTFDLKGVGQDPSYGAAIARELVAPIITRFGKRIPLLAWHCGREGLTYSPGDQVSVSIPGIPNGRGGRGLTNQVVTLLSVEKRYLSPSSQYPCKMIGICSLGGNFGLYAPSAAVTAKGTVPSDFVTLAVNTFTQANCSKPIFASVDPADYADILFFLGAGKIRLWRKGREDAAQLLTVTSVAPEDNKIYVAGAVTVDCSLGDALVSFADWADTDLTAVQRYFTYIGELTTPTGTPFAWQ